MPWLIALVAFVVTVMRRPVDRRLKLRYIGPLALAVLGVAVGYSWVLVRPPEVPLSYLIGDLAGVLAVYFMMWSLVLATRSRALENCFGGLDRMYWWHRRAAVVGMLLLVVHIPTVLQGIQREATRVGSWVNWLYTHQTSSGASTFKTGGTLGLIATLSLLVLVTISLPQISTFLRLPYHRWRYIHRTIGVFFIAAVLHGALVDELLRGSAVLLGMLLMIGAVGTGAYLYEQLLMRSRTPGADYVVTQSRQRSHDIVDVKLAPLGPALTPRPGQFVFVRVGADRTWHEHPFTVAGVDDDHQLRLTIRTLGAGTQRLHDALEAGMPARVNGPYGMFDHSTGGQHQIWIAGGIGIAPFLGWLAQPSTLAGVRIDLFASTRTDADAVFLPELQQAAARLVDLRFHPVVTLRDGHLTAARIVQLAEPLHRDTHVYLCGPEAMVHDLTRDLRPHLADRDHLHFEYFAFR